MGSALLTLRQISLQRNINDHQFQLINLNRKLQRFTRLSSLLSSGINLSPSAIASVGGELFGDALDSMGYAQTWAEGRVDDQMAAYTNAYEQLKNGKYNDSGLGAQCALYEDENGQLITEFAEEKFYKEALKEYIEQEVMPLLNEQEKEIEDEKTNLETLIQQEEAELQSVEQAKEQAIQRETIKLG